jgi:hypothetical protein
VNIDQSRREPAPPILSGPMPAYPTITPPGALDAALAPLAELSDFEFEDLARATSTARSFSLSSKGLKDLRARIPSVANNLPFLLGALSFLYSRIDGLGEVSDSFERVIAKLVDELEFENVDTEKKKIVQKRLGELLKKNPSFGRFKKVQRLHDGFVPNATSFRSMVDLRPDFGEGDAISYQGLLKIIQFRVTTDSVNPECKEMVFQMTEESLSDLSKAVERAQSKIEALKTEPKLFGQFIEIE